MASAQPKNRPTTTHKTTTFRLRPHIHKRQTPTARGPFKQIIRAPIASRFLFTHQRFLRTLTQRQRHHRDLVIRAFDHHTTQITRSPNHTRLPRRRRHRRRIRPARRTNQHILTFFLAPNNITHTNPPKPFRPKHKRLKRLNTQTRRRDRLERPTRVPAKETITILSSSRKRPERRSRRKEKFIAAAGRIPQIKVFPENRVLRRPEHIFRVTLIRRRQQLITPARPHRDRRRPEHHKPTSRFTQSIHRNNPHPISHTRQQPTHHLRHAHTTTPRTNTNQPSPTHNTSPIDIFKEITSIQPLRIDHRPEISKRRRHTTNPDRTHNRRARPHKRLNFTIFHTTMMRTFTRPSHNTILIHFTRHQPFHNTVNIIITFTQKLPNRAHARFIQHTRNTHTPTKPPFLENLFRHNFKITLRQFQIFPINIRRAPNRTTQPHRPQHPTPHFTRHRPRIITRPPKLIHHIFLHYFLSTHKQITFPTHSKPALIIFVPETLLRRRAFHLPKKRIPTTRQQPKLPHNPPRLIRQRPLHQHITTHRINSHTVQTTFEKYFFCFLFIFTHKLPHT